MWSADLEIEPFKSPRWPRLPMPGLIFICSPGRPPQVYAAKKRPRTLQDTVYHAPLFNLFHDGRSCPGSLKYPEEMGEIPESFFASFLTATVDHRGRSKKYLNDLLQLWEELDGKDRYPLKNLVPLGKVEDILK